MKLKQESVKTVDGQYDCPECHKLFPSFNSLRGHYAAHAPRKRKKHNTVKRKAAKRKVATLQIALRDIRFCPCCGLNLRNIIAAIQLGE